MLLTKMKTDFIRTRHYVRDHEEFILIVWQKVHFLALCFVTGITGHLKGASSVIRHPIHQVNVCFSSEQIETFGLMFRVRNRFRYSDLARFVNYVSCIMPMARQDQSPFSILGLEKYQPLRGDITYSTVRDIAQTTIGFSNFLSYPVNG